MTADCPEAHRDLWAKLRRCFEPGVGWDLCKATIVETVAQLPEEIQHFVARNCQFIWLGAGTNGRSIRTDALWARYLICVNDRMTARTAPPTIAHEIAHVWHGHLAGRGRQPEAEMEAAAQAKDWGFTGPAANPAHMRRV